LADHGRREKTADYFARIIRKPGNDTNRDRIPTCGCLVESLLSRTEFFVGASVVKRCQWQRSTIDEDLERGLSRQGRNHCDWTLARLNLCPRISHPLLAIIIRRGERL
jgi:hypothetical protein